MNKFFKNKLKIQPKEKAPRPLDEIKVEYMRLATDLGNILYQIKSLEVQQGTVISKMADLAMESNSIKPEPKEEVTHGESNETTNTNE